MIEQVIKQADSLIQMMGRTLLSIKFPDDIESYFISLELCNGLTDEVNYFFTFPINPSSFQKKEPSAHSVKKTFGAVVATDTSDFIPQELTIRGNFGRSFKILTGNETKEFFGIGSKKEDDNTESEGKDGNNFRVDLNKSPFHNYIKTGYGCTKYLQRICTFSKRTRGINNIPDKLYFHNHILGESYFVKVRNLTIDQSLENNMMFNYTLQLDILSPASFVTKLSNDDLGKRLLSATLQSAINSTAKLALKAVRNVVNI